MNIAKLMIPKVCTVVLRESQTVRQGLETLLRCHYTAIPVLDDEGRYVGSVTEGDFLQQILKAGTTDPKAQERNRIGDILRKDFCPALSIEESSAVVVAAAMRQNFVPVVDSRGALCGIVTRQRVIGELARLAGISQEEKPSGE